MRRAVETDIPRTKQLTKLPSYRQRAHNIKYRTLKEQNFYPVILMKNQIINNYIYSNTTNCVVNSGAIDDNSKSNATEIAVRLEGGAGDCLLANRFIPAIKEKYPLASVHAYIDCEGNTFQKEVLETLYSSFYKTIKIIPNKKYKEF